jgi:hypothetical protein
MLVSGGKLRAQGSFDRYLSFYGHPQRSTFLVEGIVGATPIAHAQGNSIGISLHGRAHYQLTPFVSPFIGIGAYQLPNPSSEVVEALPEYAASAQIGVRHTLLSVYPFERYRRKLNLAATFAYEQLFAISDSLAAGGQYGSAGYLNLGLEVHYYLSDNLFIIGNYSRRLNFISEPQYGVLGGIFALGVAFRPVRYGYKYDAFLRRRK